MTAAPEPTQTSTALHDLLARLHDLADDLATPVADTGAYGNGYRAARDFDLARLQAVLAATGTATTGGRTLDRSNDPFYRQANCTNYLEVQDRPCTGTLTFYLGDPQAACDSCGAWCGWLVADYRPYHRGNRTENAS